MGILLGHHLVHSHYTITKQRPELLSHNLQVVGILLSTTQRCLWDRFSSCATTSGGMSKSGVTGGALSGIEEEVAAENERFVGC